MIEFVNIITTSWLKGVRKQLSIKISLNSSLSIRRNAKNDVKI